MRVSRSLHRMVILSFLLHLCFIAAVSVTIRRNYPLYLPKSISVNIVSRVSGGKAAGPVSQPVEEKVQKKEVVAKKSPPQKSPPPPPKKAQQEVSKAEMQMLEDRMQLLKAKKRIEEISRLRAVIDISTRGISEKVRNARSGTQPPSESAPGSPSGEGAAEGILTDYISAVSAQIRREWVYPELLLKEGLEAVILVRIQADGNVQILGIEKSSQNGIYDRSVIRAITKASPVKPPPYAMEVGLRFRP